MSIEINFQRYLTSLTVQETLDVLSARSYLNSSVSASDIPSHLRAEGVFTWLFTNYTTQNVDFTPKTKVPTPLNKHPWQIKQELKQLLSASGSVLVSLLTRDRASSLISDEALTSSNDEQATTRIIYNNETPGTFDYLTSNEPSNGTVPLPAWNQPTSVPRTPRSIANTLTSLLVSPTHYATVTLLNMSIWSDVYNNNIYSDTLGSSIGSGVSYPYLGSTLEIQVPSGFCVSPWADRFMIPSLSGIWNKWMQELSSSGASLNLVHVGIEPPTTFTEYFGSGNLYRTVESGNTYVTAPSGVTALSTLRSDSRYSNLSGLLGFDIPSDFTSISVGYLPCSGYTDSQIFNDVAHSQCMQNFKLALANQVAQYFPNSDFTNFQNQHKCLTIPWSQGTNNWNSPWGIGHPAGNSNGLGTSFYGALNRNRGDGTFLWNQVYVDWASGVGSTSIRFKTVGPTDTEDVSWSALLNSLLSALTAQCCSTRRIYDYGKFPEEAFASGCDFNFQEGTLHKMLMGVQILQDGNSAYNSSGNAVLHNNLAKEFNHVIPYWRDTIRPIPSTYYGDSEVNYEYWRCPYILTTSDVGGILWTRVTPRRDKYNTTILVPSGLNGVSGLAISETTSGRTTFLPRGEVFSVSASYLAAPSGYWVKQPNRTGGDRVNYLADIDAFLDGIFGNPGNPNKGFTTIFSNRPVNQGSSRIMSVSTRLGDATGRANPATGIRTTRDSNIVRDYATGELTASGTSVYDDFNQGDGFRMPTKDDQGEIRVIYPSKNPQSISLPSQI